MATNEKIMTDMIGLYPTLSKQMKLQKNQILKQIADYTSRRNSIQKLILDSNQDLLETRNEDVIVPQYELPDNDGFTGTGFYGSFATPQALLTSINPVAPADPNGAYLSYFDNTIIGDGSNDPYIAYNAGFDVTDIRDWTLEVWEYSEVASVWASRIWYLYTDGTPGPYPRLGAYDSTTPSQLADTLLNQYMSDYDFGWDFIHHPLDSTGSYGLQALIDSLTSGTDILDANTTKYDQVSDVFSRNLEE